MIIILFKQHTWASSLCNVCQSAWVCDMTRINKLMFACKTKIEPHLLHFWTSHEVYCCKLHFKNILYKMDPYIIKFKVKFTNCIQISKKNNEISSWYHPSVWWLIIHRMIRIQDHEKWASKFLLNSTRNLYYKDFFESLNEPNLILCWYHTFWSEKVASHHNHVHRKRPASFLQQQEQLKLYEIIVRKRRQG